ncbi:MAG: PQQ-binding-like beta-propeller repeat protein [Candidatus Hodarchaeota archaeon]
MVDSGITQKESSTVMVNIEKVSSFRTPAQCYGVSIGQITQDIPQLVLSCYDDYLYIYGADGKKHNVLEWSSKFTSLAIGYITQKNQKSLISGSIDGVVRAIDMTGDLIWQIDLEKPIKSLSLGNFDKDKTSEVLVAVAQVNAVILLKNTGEILWRKSFPSQIVSAIIEETSNKNHTRAIVMESEGQIHFLDKLGKLERTVNIGKKISQGSFLKIGAFNLIATSHQGIVTIWNLTDEFKELTQHEEKTKIRVMTTGRIFDSNNDIIVILTRDGLVSVLRPTMRVYGKDGKLLSKDELVEAETDLDQLRPVLSELFKSFGISGIPIVQLHNAYIANTGARLSYSSFYTDLLKFQSRGQLGGRIDHYGTPDAVKDDLLVLSGEKFFCMSCNQQLPVFDSHYQCDQCFRFLCKECHETREIIEFIECPFCQADGSHIHIV